MRSRSHTDIYEVEFEDEVLGFTVTNMPGSGTVVVNRIVDSANEGRMYLGDTVFALEATKAIDLFPCNVSQELTRSWKFHT